MNKKAKKIIIITASILLILASLALINFTKSPISRRFTVTSYLSSDQQLIAHRGFSSVYPENTLPAISGAFEKNYYGCEFDIHTTKDGIWVLNHDSDIDKMTDGEGEIADYTYEELLSYNIDNGNGIENYSDLKLPTLHEALSLLSESSVIPVVEIKGYDPEAFSDLLKILGEYNYIDTAIIISFDMEALLGIRELNENIRLMYLTNKLSEEDVDICLKNGNIGVNINGGNIFEMTDAVKYAQENGLECAAWTVDFPVLADILGLFDITTITTNRITP